tara:strand:- start:411 stop:1073 length:663 start_codon:yes stop_codon:yes gene_type:complete
MPRDWEFDTESSDYTMLQDILSDLGGETRTFGGKDIKGWNQDPDTLMNAMRLISLHETGGTESPTQMQLQGKEGQEGMGLFQYEKGKGHGAHTAINRLESYFEGRGMDVPEWLSSVNEESGWDVSSLSPSQQYMLFLGDKALDPTAHMRDVDTVGGLRDFWEKEHWAGHKYGENNQLLNPEVVKARQESFDETIEHNLKKHGDSMGFFKDTMLDQLASKK